MSSKSGPPRDIECGIVRSINAVMGDSLDDIARQAQPNPLQPQHGAHHHG